jgi:hypothetical protein
VDPPGTPSNYASPIEQGDQPAGAFERWSSFRTDEPRSGPAVEAGRQDRRSYTWLRRRENRVSIIADHDVAEVAMNGLLLWGLVLPILLVVAGVVTLRRRNGRR